MLHTKQDIFLMDIAKNQFTNDQPNTEYIGIISRGGL